MANESESSSASDRGKNAPAKMSQLQIILIFVTGVCFLINALVSLSHSYGPNDHKHAIHQAVDDFKKGVDKKSKVAGGNVKIDMDAEAMPGAKKDNVIKPISNLPKTKPQSKIAKLSCGQYGGPADEFASEMVYWSDIPSDSHYVSPLRSQRGSRRQYMTFEPDGGNFPVAIICSKLS